MAITVKYFASLSERLGRREELIEAAADMTVASVWAKVGRRALSRGTSKNRHSDEEEKATRKKKRSPRRHPPE